MTKYEKGVNTPDQRGVYTPKKWVFLWMLKLKSISLFVLTMKSDAIRLGTIKV